MPGSKREIAPGKWRLEVYAGRRADGKYRRASKTFEGTEAAAERELQRFWTEAHAGKVNAAGKMTVAELCSRYIDHVDDLIAVGDRHKSAPRAYRPAIYKWIAPELRDRKTKERRLGGIKVNRITDTVMQQWVDDMRAAGLSPKTVINYASIASSIFSYARKDLKIIQVDPCANLRLPTVHKAESRAYTSAELFDIMEAIDAMPEDQLHYKAAFLIAIWGGLRLSEIVGLNDDSVDYDASAIRVYNTRQFTPGIGLQEDVTKSAAGTRTVTLPKEVMTVIRDLQDWQEQLKEFWGARWHDTPALIKRPEPYAPKEPGEPVEPKAVYRAFKRLCKSAGVEAKGLHALRHTHASLIAALPESTLSDLQHRLGHAELSTTLNIYTHLFDDSGQKIADALSSHFFHNKDEK